MTTTIPTPSLSFVPVALSSLAGAPPASAPLPYVSPPPSAANDAPPAQADDAEHAEYAALLAHPRIRSFLMERMRAKQLQASDKEDIFSAVRETLWKRRHDRHPPRTLPRVLGLAKKIVDGKIVDFFRHAAVVRERFRDAPRVNHDEDAPPGDSPSDQPNYVEELRSPCSVRPDDELETKRRKAFVNEMAPQLGLTRDDVDVMFTMTWDSDATWTELAAERGETPAKLRQRIGRLQAKMRKAWARRIAPKVLLTLLIVAMLVLYALTIFGPARNPPPPAPLPEPTVHEVGPVAPTTTAQSLPTGDAPGRKPR
jgi:hypothetical protein